MIDRRDYEAYKACIGSDQVPAADIIAIRRDNPEFAAMMRANRQNVRRQHEDRS